MIENIISALGNLKISNELNVMILSMLPISELRGAIPVAVFNFHFTIYKAYIIAVIGNLIPILPIIYFLEPIRKQLSKIKIFKKFFDWLYNRAYKKSKKVMKYGAIGLALFVAIPLPLTGAWTGSIAAILFDIKPKYAFPSIILGVLTAGIIVSLIVKGILIIQL